MNQINQEIENSRLFPEDEEECKALKFPRGLLYSLGFGVAAGLGFYYFNPPEKYMISSAFAFLSASYALTSVYCSIDSENQTKNSPLENKIW